MYKFGWLAASFYFKHFKKQLDRVSAVLACVQKTRDTLHCMADIWPNGEIVNFTFGQLN